ncbi:MAG TPA: hypothetical protein DEP63_03600 [Candidatus Magasanikbacteria bacterium]|uniref:SH3b domain-containing protein n=1 Tax=Candidatus Magasanikbacteria bacterium GW2011_GWE2_42_7 TaxID=1619052 RepID=A0A0G1BC70_9BACT|nr:MAG: hypothetical protein UV18_C0001G0082 [Candidatus Magasanikbacteria bacterium GW2011_GWC2_42_27]KKS70779.1 MAG: hypothetical protein UV42_C0044G0004 [Candidatus Magasanikbacteria bacterium GW2011_GWE2_42_7]KKT24818.1 MAG: hypothetical protein UW10_C0019G0004 [Candidatus Magasanikbacteria bacterium GW2011_GWA2_43_9]HBB37550.1 hypothetical protein [Candidatus Magasanikbacteria bacterium]HCC13806.1 hypothetical protein [Candidatus Magasanikbacteria bacterium]
MPQIDLSKKIVFTSILTIAFLVFAATPAPTHAAETPEGYTPITWVGESGIQSFIKAPESAGYIDYITVIDLTKNDIKLISTSTPRVYGGAAISPFSDVLTKNWLFARAVVESFKKGHPEAKFIWNAPFFNVEMSTTVLSLGLKSSDAEGPFINSGARSEPDMAQPRRMLIIDNTEHRAKIADFDATVFVNEGDQAVEGFDPFGVPSNKAAQASRVYLGVRNDGKELIVYCSKSASNQEASNGLLSAGVLPEYQIQVDGGGSATCGYNLPGQYFVEPGRAVPHIMGAIPSVEKGTVTINNLNVRTGAGANNPAVRKLPLGAEVTMYEVKNGWVRISDTEWVSASYIKKIQTLPYSAKVTVANLNVRSGAGSSFAVMRKLALGEVVQVHEEKNGWLRISPSEWVMGTYVE